LRSGGDHASELPGLYPRVDEERDRSYSMSTDLGEPPAPPEASHQTGEEPSTFSVFNPRVLFEESREGLSARNGCTEAMFIIRISTLPRGCSLVNEQ
jgi:hypothetical protein